MVGELRDLGEGGVGDRDRGGVAVARELHRANHERVRAPGREADHHGLVVDAAELCEVLLARRGNDLGAQVEQHQQVTQVAREEGHLVGAAEHDAIRVGDQVDGGGDLVAVHLAGGLGEVGVVGGDGRLELGLVDRKQRRAGQLGGGAVLTRAPVLVTRGGLQLREALEAERLREAHDGGARGVRPPRQLLRRVKGRFLEMVDDVLPDVLLGARELVEALADLLRESECGRARSRHGRGFRRGAGSSFRRGACVRS